MSKEYTYRLADENDIAQLQQLCLTAYGQFRPILSAQNWEKWQSGFNNKATFSHLLDIAKCFICESKNEIIAMAFLIPSGNPFLYFEKEWSYIRLLAVSLEHQGKGLGKLLTQQCMEEAKRSGEKYIALHTSEFQNAARHIYQSLGFDKQQEFELYDKKYWIFKLKL